MARLIDADALIERCKRIASIDYNNNVAPTSWVHAYEDFIIELEDAPTIYAEPVVHARWLYWGFDSECSNCGYENRAESITRMRNDTPYCPHCGARMDGKTNE